MNISINFELWHALRAVFLLFLFAFLILWRWHDYEYGRCNHTVADRIDFALPFVGIAAAVLAFIFMFKGLWFPF